MGTNIWKTAAVILSVLQITQAWKIWACKGSTDDCLTFSYENAAQICTSGYFDLSLNTTFFIHGYKSSLDKEIPKELMNTLLAKGGTNVLGIDWSDKANSILIVVDYIIFAQKVSNEMTSALISMTCLTPDKIIIIGMSLGAQIAGNVGRQYREQTGNAIALITGLDPAKPLYDDPLIIFKGIDVDSAKCVVIYHTDRFKYGISSQRGTIDCWPNANTVDMYCHQPGCPVSYPAPLYTFTDDDLCNHRLAAQLYIQALLNPCGLIAIEAFDTADWVAGKGNQSRLLCIAYEVNTGLSGNFFLRTTPDRPYGLGMAGTTADLE